MANQTLAKQSLANISKINLTVPNEIPKVFTSGNAQEGMSVLQSITQLYDYLGMDTKAISSYFVDDAAVVQPWGKFMLHVNTTMIGKKGVFNTKGRNDSQGWVLDMATLDPAFTGKTIEIFKLRAGDTDQVLGKNQIHLERLSQLAAMEVPRMNNALVKTYKVDAFTGAGRVSVSNDGALAVQEYYQDYHGGKDISRSQLVRLVNIHAAKRPHQFSDSKLYDSALAAAMSLRHGMASGSTELTRRITAESIRKIMNSDSSFSWDRTNNYLGCLQLSANVADLDWTEIKREFLSKSKKFNEKIKLIKKKKVNVAGDPNADEAEDSDTGVAK